VSLGAIVTAINAAAVTGLHVELRKAAAVPGTNTPYQYLVMWCSGGATIDKAGTANALFGLSAVADTLIADAVDRADVVSINNGCMAGHYVLVLET
jgi:hypothetical protein